MFSEAGFEVATSLPYVCNDFPEYYIGQTGRDFYAYFKEHITSK